MDTVTESDAYAPTISKAGIYEYEYADRLLDQLIGFWRKFPEFVEEWAEWDEFDRLVYVEDWPVTAMKLSDLQRWNEEGLLNEEQRRRFGELMGYVEQYRGTLDRLFRE